MSNEQNTLNTETPNTYGTKSNAARALRKIGPGLEDLLEQTEDGRWTFDVADAKALASLEGDHNPDLDEVNTKDTKMTEDTEKKNYSLAEALKEEEQLNASENVGKVGKAQKPAQTDEEKAAKEAAKKEKAERAAAEKAAKAEARKLERAQKNAEKDAEKEASKAEREQRAAAKLAEKEATKAAREAKAAAKAEAKQAREDKKAKAAQDKLDAELARKEAKAAAREAREATVKNGIRLPGANSKLGKLWSLIEGLKEATGEFPTFQDFKAATEGMSYEDKGGPATVTTAYYDYRMYHGVTGRIVAPKSEAEEAAPTE